jgi:hypothetical protein
MEMQVLVLIELQLFAIDKSALAMEGIGKPVTSTICCLAYINLCCPDDIHLQLQGLLRWFFQKLKQELFKAKVKANLTDRTCPHALGSHVSCLHVLRHVLIFLSLGSCVFKTCFHVPRLSHPSLLGQ